MSKYAKGDLPVKAGKAQDSVEVRVVATAVGPAAEYAIFRAPYDITITKVSIVNDIGITGANTSTFTAKLMNRGADNSGTVILASKAYTSGVSAVALVAETLTLNTTATNLNVSEGDVLTYYSHQVNLGLNDPAKVVVVEYQYQ